MPRLPSTATVLKAIVAHDADAARAAMQRHLNKAYKRFNTGWDARAVVARPARRRTIMLTCRIHAKEDLRIETAELPEVGARPGADPPRRRGHLRFRPALLLRRPQRQLRRSRAADSRARSLGRRRQDRRRRHPRQVGRQDRGQPVACVRAMRLLPRGTRAALPQHALPGQRQPLSARAGHVLRVFRDGRAAMLSGGRRRLAGRDRVRRAAGGRRCTRSTAARELLGKSVLDHRRRDDRLPDGDRRAAGRSEARRGVGHARPAARHRASRSAPIGRYAPTGSPMRSRRRNTTSRSRCPAASPR